ncbi:acylglycerol lipase [Burkholderia multivorans]|uniref:Acylglycerol lipase n=2 Tax=Burkholderia multivorans TaxID=87883 RepID=A0ABD7L6U6_9BURK|nr:acylglycerol lipase [Burkholderia multivorans]
MIERMFVNRAFGLGCKGDAMSGEVTVDDFRFVSDADKAPIYGRRWSPIAGKAPRALIQITHGISEHSGRYDRFARILADQGYVVYALDLRAHGNTAPSGTLGLAGVDAWALMKSDIFQLGEIARAAYPGLPLIAFGHSMGSALTQAYAQERGAKLAGVVLCGTMGGFPGQNAAAIHALLPKLKQIAESRRANEPAEFMQQMLIALNTPFASVDLVVGTEWMTSDPTEQARFLADPLCGALFCNSLTYAVVEGFQSLWTWDAEMRIPPGLPVLIICGTEDTVGGNTDTVRQLVNRYMRQGHLDLSYVFYPGARHEILNEACKDKVHRDVAGWLSSVLG